MGEDRPVNQNKEGHHSEGFYRLIPRGKGFQGLPQQTTEQNFEFQHTKTYQSRLVSLFGYKNSRKLEDEKILYLKEDFILRNSLSFTMSDPKEALQLLVADRYLLFNEADSVFRSRMQNSKFLSMQKTARRAIKEIGRKDIDGIFTHTGKAESEGYGEVKAKVLLKAVVDDARSKRRSVYDWLYSQRHIAVTERNRAEYEEKYRSYPDGYYDGKKLFPAGTKEQRKFIHDIVKRGNPNNTWLLDIERCGETFKGLLQNENTGFITEDFCEEFINIYLARYIRLQRSRKENLLGYEGYCDRDRICANFAGFIEKKTRLEELEKEFRSQSLTDKGFDGRSDIEEWGISKTRDTIALSEDKVRIIVEAIRSFFENLNIKLKEPEEKEDILKGRVRWVLESRQLENYEKRERAILLLSMVLSCGKRIEQDTDVRFEIEKAMVGKLRGVSNTKQRLEEIKLLHQIHNALRLSWGEQSQNWEEYLLRRDKKICSIEEYLFWRELLQGEYERLPLIGFQLCFVQYVDECLPAHYETLSYSLTSDAQLNGYKKFLIENFKEIEQLAAELSSHPDYIKKYLKNWNNPKKTGRELQEVLGEILADFQSEYISQYCPDAETQLLALETALRMCIREQAKEKLYNWFGKVYGCSLRHALHHNVS